MANKIQLRRDTSSNWTSSNPTLSQGELGHETNTGKLKVGDGSTAWNSLGYVDTTYTHPNHSGEVTSTGDGAMVIADNVVDEANLKVSNSPTDGYVLTAQSGNTGGLTWEAASGGSSIGGSTGVDFNDNVKARFGTGNDLEIYHDGSSSIIESTTLGAYTRIKSAGGIVLAVGTLENALFAAQNGKTSLYYDGSEKIETTSSGIQTTGTVNVNGAYTLPTADGSANQVLTTNGSGVASWAAASGGGSPDLFDENYDGSSTAPSASGSNSVSIGVGASSGASNAFSAGLNSNASGLNSTAIGRNATAGGQESASFGGWANTPTYSTGAVALGKSYASGTYSLAAVINNNTSSYGATGASSVAIGYQAKATNQYGIAIGYQAQAISGGGGVAIGRAAKAYSNAISIGENGWGGGTNAAEGQGSIAIGQNNAAEKTASVIIGINGKANVVGKYVYSNGYLGGQGNAQTGTFVLISDTTDATAEALTTNKSSASTDNQIILPNNSAYSFSGTIVARESAAAGSDYASWEIKGALLRDANAASTVLGNGIVNKLYATSGASAWAVALSADTTNGGLKVQVTGAASTNIRWVATVNTSEVTYA